jgi:hypothetical protein
MLLALLRICKLMRIIIWSCQYFLDFRLPPWCTWRLCSSAVLCSVDLQLLTMFWESLSVPKWWQLTTNQQCIISQKSKCLMPAFIFPGVFLALAKCMLWRHNEKVKKLLGLMLKTHMNKESHWSFIYIFLKWVSIIYYWWGWVIKDPCKTSMTWFWTISIVTAYKIYTTQHFGSILLSSSGFNGHCK